MDTWKFYDITHRDHVFCNPLNPALVPELLALLKLPAGAKVVDIASGKGELLVRLAEMYGIDGQGVDISPFCIADARLLKQQRVPDANIKFIHGKGAEWRPIEPESMDLTSCIGAEFVFGSQRKTLDALVGWTRPGGWVLIGQWNWRIEPPAEYLKATGMTPDETGTEAENAAQGDAFGLELHYLQSSAEADWDRYEALQWNAAHNWALENPDDPDVNEVLTRVNREREIYLKWGKRTAGFSIYLYRKPA